MQGGPAAEKCIKRIENWSNIGPQLIDLESPAPPTMAKRMANNCEKNRVTEMEIGKS